MLNLALDTYANLDSPIHRWDVRYKLIGLLGLIFAFSFVQDFILLPFIIIITLLAFSISRLPFSFFVERIKYPGIFLLAVAVIFPLFSGTTILLQLGPLAIRSEGLSTLLLVSVKFVCILTLSLVLFGTASFLTTIKAMRALRLSPILSDIMLLTYRYIFDIGYDLHKMETAMRLRDFRPGKFSFQGIRTLSSLLGTLLVRSFERSERIYKAMILRGYAYQIKEQASTQQLFHARRQDRLALLGVLLLSGAIICAHFLLRLG